MGDCGINVIAEFTADSTSILSTFSDLTGARTVLNGYALHELAVESVPEPAPLAVLSLG
jgi:hypothetical protein